MILVVDDYPDSAIALALYLRKLGYTTQTAFDGPSALAVIRSHPPEQPLLVVLDEMMPNMSGIEVVKAIRADPKIAHTAIVFYTAGFDVDRRDESMSLGVLAWYYKGGGRGSTFDMVVKELIHHYQHAGGVKLQQPNP